MANTVVLEQTSEILAQADIEQLIGSILDSDEYDILAIQSVDLTSPDLTRHQKARAAIDFYNIAHGGEGAVCHFIEKYIVGLLPTQGNLTDEEYQTEKSRFIDAQIEALSFLIVNELPVYKAIVDKVLGREGLLREELVHITTRMMPEIEVKQSASHQLWIHRHNSDLGILEIAYQSLVHLSQGRVQVSRCKAVDCQKLYIPTPRGRDQKYCSHACKMKEYRKRKKINS